MRESPPRPSLETARPRACARQGDPPPPKPCPVVRKESPVARINGPEDSRLQFPGWTRRTLPHRPGVERSCLFLERRVDHFRALVGEGEELVGIERDALLAHLEVQVRARG